ncbi:hypothetical protein [Nonomuraea sp. NPDC049504]|uniref:hypothetical protein n=1 Tax=Nonomuraea sp. NPDC049504 TaxID=3154729 RepID=UPI00342ED217
MANWPDYVTTAGPEAIDLAKSAGLHLDPWQQFVLTHGLGETAEGLWSAPKLSVWVPRQNGKGAILEARALAGLFLLRERLILWSAHEFKTAAEAFIRIKELIQGTPHLHKRVRRYWEGNGEQGIELHQSAGGSRLRFVARSRGSGRGFSGDLIILDEAQELTGAQMAAMLPTISARPNAQVLFTGTPPDDPTAWCYGLKEDGEAGVERLAHFDWGADLDLSSMREIRESRRNVDLWYSCNPSLGIRIRHETVVDEAKASGLGDRFPIERLGVWHPRAADGPSVMRLEDWEALADLDSRVSGPLAIAVDITPDRAMSSIALYGLRRDELGHAEVIDRRPGTDWVVERLVQLKKRHNPVAIGLDAKGPAGSLLVDLAKVGIKPPDDPEKPKRGDLFIPTAGEVAAACGQLVDAVAQSTMRHIDQQETTDALRGAKTRPLGDAWAWGRRLSNVDISPLVGITLARAAFVTRAHVVREKYDPLANIF